MAISKTRINNALKKNGIQVGQTITLAQFQAVAKYLGLTDKIALRPTASTEADSPAQVRLARAYTTINNTTLGLKNENETAFYIRSENYCSNFILDTDVAKKKQALKRKIARANRLMNKI